MPLPRTGGYLLDRDESMVPEHGFDNHLIGSVCSLSDSRLPTLLAPQSSDFPLEEKVGALRKIGVGVMCMAQMLYQMGVPYDSKFGRDICSEILRIINRETAINSAEIAEERGTFGAYEESKWANPTEHED